MRHWSMHMAENFTAAGKDACPILAHTAWPWTFRGAKFQGQEHHDQQI